MTETTMPPRPLGQQRDDDLLSLDAAGLAHRRALVTLARTVLTCSTL